MHAISIYHFHIYYPTMWFHFSMFCTILFHVCVNLVRIRRLYGVLVIRIN